MRGPTAIQSVVRFHTAPIVMARSLMANSFVLRTLVRNEILTRYSNTMLGVVWSLINPLMMIVIYSFVFGIVFEVRFGQAPGQTEMPYAVVLFSGLLLHVFLSDTLMRAQSVVLDNTNYVKRVIFPLEILPVATLIANLVHAVVAAAVLILVILILGFPIPATALLLPVVWAPLMLVTLGMAMVVASLGVFVRDIGQVLGFLMTILMFGSSILFPIDRLPVSIQPWLLLNPLTIIVNESRNVLLWGSMPNWVVLAKYTLVAGAAAWIGCWWFLRTRRGFADVM